MARDGTITGREKIAQFVGTGLINIINVLLLFLLAISFVTYFLTADTQFIPMILGIDYGILINNILDIIIWIVLAVIIALIVITNRHARRIFSMELLIIEFILILCGVFMLNVSVVALEGLSLITVLGISVFIINIVLGILIVTYSAMVLFQVIT